MEWCTGWSNPGLGDEVMTTLNDITGHCEWTLTQYGQHLKTIFFLLRLGVHAASNSAYSGYPELWILRYPAHS
jgi:hypothetical protein